MTDSMTKNTPSPAAEVADTIAEALSKFTDAYLVVINDSYQPKFPRHYTHPFSLHEFINSFEDMDCFYSMLEDIRGGEFVPEEFELTVDEQNAFDDYLCPDTPDSYRDEVYELVLHDIRMTKTLRWFFNNAKMVVSEIQKQQERLLELMWRFKN
jgi:hypothetical protein